MTPAGAGRRSTAQDAGRTDPRSTALMRGPNMPPFAPEDERERALLEQHAKLEREFDEG